MEVDAADLADALAERVDEAVRCVRGVDGLSKDLPGFGLHRPPVTSGPKLQAVLELLVDVTDRDRSHPNGC